MTFISPVIFFSPQHPKRNTKAPTFFFLGRGGGMNTLTGTKTTFLTPIRCNEHPVRYTLEFPPSTSGLSHRIADSLEKQGTNI